MLNRLRELTKSLRNPVESERTEQLRRTKAEVEKNVTRILKLIKNEDQQGKGKRKASKRETELLGLVENLYKEYESLYDLCEHLIAESGKRVVVKNGSEYSSDSSSESEYFSSEEIDINNAKLDSEASELKHKLASINEENKTLELKYNSALTKVQEVENVNKDLKIEVDKKGREISALVMASEANGKQSSARIKELEGQLAGLKTEIKSLRGKAGEAKQLEDKRKGLHSKVLKLETVLKEKEDENSVLMKKLEEDKKSFTLRIAELVGQASNKQAEIDSLRAKRGELEKVLACERENGLAQFKELVDQKIGLEAELDRKTAEISDNLVKIKSLNEELAQKILDEKQMVVEEENQVSSLLNQKDDEASSQVMDLTKQIIDKKENLDSLKNKKRELESSSDVENQENTKTLITQIENQSTKLREKIGDKSNPQVVERKIEDMAEKLRISFEDNLRLLHQRILVTEQLHNENKESYKAAKERYERENRELEEKLGAYEHEFKQMKEVSEVAQYALNGLDLVVSKFEEENGNFLNRVSKVSNELKFAKRWVKGTTCEIKRLKHNVDCLVAFLDHKEEQEFLLRDKVWKLEAKVSKEGGEKMNLIQEISQLEKKLGKYERLLKEKDERLINLGDEKREAIRQLCILVDYHRCRVDHLKQVVTKMRLGW